MHADYATEQLHFPSSLNFLFGDVGVCTGDWSFLVFRYISMESQYTGMQLFYYTSHST